MQHTIYAKRLVPILIFFGAMVGSGTACFKSVERKYWSNSSEPDGAQAPPVDQALAGVIEKANCTLPDQKMVDQDGAQANGLGQSGSSICYAAQPSNLLVANPPVVVPDKPIVVLPVTYQDQLLRTLSDSNRFEPYLKQYMRNVIQAHPERMVRFEHDNIPVVQALDCIAITIEEEWAQQVTAQIQQEQEAEELTQHLYAELELDLEHQIPQDQAAEASIRDLAPRPEECDICYETFGSEVIKTRLPCNHFFCASCLSKQQQNTCAMCRAVFNPEDLDL